MESPGTGAGGGLASFFAEREMLKRKWLDNKKGLKLLGLKLLL